MIGPKGKKQRYVQPSGWTRYGQRVLGKYTDGNDWLEPFNGRKNWYRAYHGTKNAKAEDFKNSNENFDPKGASVDAMASIYKDGFQKARIGHYGAGVYCSPNPLFPEKDYVSPVEIDTELGRKQFKFMLQVSMNPEGVTISTDDIWLVGDPKNIRPYGILIKEC